MKKILLTAALAAVFATGCSSSSATPDSSAASSSGSAKLIGAKKPITEDTVPEMSADEVDAALAKPGSLYVFDANPKEVFDSGHVPTAKWVPFDKVTADMLPQDKNAKLIFYCANEH
jgi:hypothetical protein